VVFANPEALTAEDVADYTNSQTWTAFGDTPAVTAEEIADALNALGLTSFGGTPAVTPEDLGIAINSGLASVGPTPALRAWRAW
jgi:hypothetical protein